MCNRNRVLNIIKRKPMKVLLDIKDKKASALLAVLKDLPYVKIKILTPYKAEVIENMVDAIQEIKLIEEGKLKARNAKDFLNEL